MICGDHDMSKRDQIKLANRLLRSTNPTDRRHAAALFRLLEYEDHLGAAFGHGAMATVSDFLAGDRDDVTRDMVEAIARRTKKPATEAPWTVTNAYCALLEDAAGDAKRFADLWREAVAHPIILRSDRYFPHPEWAQDRLLALALASGTTDIARALVAVIRTHRKAISRALAALMSQVAE